MCVGYMFTFLLSLLKSSLSETVSEGSKGHSNYRAMEHTVTSLCILE